MFLGPVDALIVRVPPPTPRGSQDGVPTKRRSQSPPKVPAASPSPPEINPVTVRQSAGAVALVAVCGLKNRSGECFGQAVARAGPGALAAREHYSFLRAFFDVLLTWGTGTRA